MTAVVVAFKPAVRHPRVKKGRARAKVIAFPQHPKISAADVMERTKLLARLAKQWGIGGEWYSDALPDLRNAGEDVKRAPVTQSADRVTGNILKVTVCAERYANGADYDNPANLPDEVATASSMIEGGAYEMAKLIRRQMAMPAVKALVAAWVQAMRAGIVGGPGQPQSIADEDWPDPPIGLTHWCEHPYFQGDPLSPCDWEEIESDYAAGHLEKVAN